MTRLYILTAVGILGPLAFAALVAWLPRRHRLRERRGTLCLLRIRRALAPPVYMVALILDFPSAALGCLAAGIAGDHWPGKPSVRPGLSKGAVWAATALR
jgi:hypothetical protein